MKELAGKAAEAEAAKEQKAVQKAAAAEAAKEQKVLAGLKQLDKNVRAKVLAGLKEWEEEQEAQRSRPSLGRLLVHVHLRPLCACTGTKPPTKSTSRAHC